MLNLWSELHAWGKILISSGISEQHSYENILNVFWLHHSVFFSFAGYSFWILCNKNANEPRLRCHAFFCQALSSPDLLVLYALLAKPSWNCRLKSCAWPMKCGTSMRSLLVVCSTHGCIHHLLADSCTLAWLTGSSRQEALNCCCSGSLVELQVTDS